MKLVNEPRRHTPTVRGAPPVAALVAAPVATAPVKAPLLVPFGPSQKYGDVNQVALQIFGQVIDTERLTPVTGMIPRPQGQPMRPWEDARAVAVHFKPKAAAEEATATTTAPALPTAKALGGDFVFEGTIGNVQAVLALWAATTHAALWTTSVGTGVASFAISRYGQAALQYDRRGKLEHVVEVLHNADRITLDQAAHGEPLDPKWRQYLEYAALLHDVGYMNGGFMHPKKGGNDMLYHLKEHLRERGVDDKSLTDADIEKMALIVELHGDSFPWGQIGDAQDCRRLSPGKGRFGDFPYLSLKVVDEIFAQPGRTEALITAMKKENEVYLQEKGGLAWLDDPDEVRELIRVGYVMHAADKYKGPSAKQIDSRAGTTPGVSAPLTSLKEVDNYLRAQDVDAAGRGVRDAASQVFRRILEQTPPHERPAMRKKVLAPLQQALASICALADNSLSTPTAKSAALSSSMKQVADTKWVKELDHLVASLKKKEHRKLVDEAVAHVFGKQATSLSDAMRQILLQTANDLAILPEYQA